MAIDNGTVVCYIVRHGQTKANDQGIFRGLKNFPLDEKGVQDAEEARDYLKDKTIGSAYTSDLDRARKTAHIVLGPDKKIKVLSSLEPIDVGSLSGKKKDEHKEIMQYLQDNKDEPFPGGGQTINEFNKQSRKPLLAAIRAGVQNGSPSLVSTHASVVHSLGHLLHEDHKAALVKPGGIVEVTWDGERFNATPVFKAKDAQENKESIYAS